MSLFAMLGIGSTELIIIGVIALFVLVLRSSNQEGMRSAGRALMLFFGFGFAALMLLSAASIAYAVLARVSSNNVNSDSLGRLSFVAMAGIIIAVVGGILFFLLSSNKERNHGDYTPLKLFFLGAAALITVAVGSSFVYLRKESRGVAIQGQLREEARETADRAREEARKLEEAILETFNEQGRERYKAVPPRSEKVANPRPEKTPDKPSSPQSKDKNAEAPDAKSPENGPASPSPSKDNPAAASSPDKPPADADSTTSPASQPGEGASASPSPRPAWVDGPLTPGPGKSYKTRVTVGPYSTQEECESALLKAQQTALNAYVDEAIARNASRVVRVPPAFLQQRVERARYAEVVPTVIGIGREYPMIRLHALLEFDVAAHGELQEMYRGRIVSRRLGYIGVGMGTFLALLTTMFGYLKIDTATRGYYSGRLKFLAATVIVAVGGVAAVLLEELS